MFRNYWFSGHMHFNYENTITFKKEDEKEEYKETT